ncbi:MAG: GNAT family N-acetyltransferase [Acidobacteria bacterium]|nr:GNAT family N-acetyltransferase [Acidobacteriota bacterium]MCA1638260.1 GNAT family N-acetyltransferase [Acidobacteriota bacterium]
MKKITKRPAEATDMEFARSVHHRAYRDVVLKQYGTWNEKAQNDFFADVWYAATHQIVIYENVLCGYICVEYRDEDIHIRELVIDPEFQSKGIGTFLLREVIDDAEARQVPVRLGTQQANRAINLYRKLGFREFDRTETHVLMEWKSG